MKLLILLLSISSLLLTTTEGSAAYDTDGDGEKLLSVLTTTEGSAVYDTDGEKLVVGKAYTILIDPIGRERICHTMFSLGRHHNTCPLTLTVIRSPCDRAVRFYPVNASDTFVQQLTDVNIEFVKPSKCSHDPPVWKLADTDWATGRRYVTTGGAKGNPGAATANNWFKIQESGKYYKLLHCPSVCATCDRVCGYLGLNNENGTSWLGLHGKQFQVVFRKEQRVCTRILCPPYEMGPYQE